MNRTELIYMPINKMLALYPFMESHIEDQRGLFKDFELSPYDNIIALTIQEKEDLAIDEEQALNTFEEYFRMMCDFLGIGEEDKVKSLTILPGTNKSKEQEGFQSLKIQKGEIIAIVGPTGSGKSRLLADIEWTADCDTPTGRKILINDAQPDKKWRFSSGNKLVAQLSQNMNFVMDLTVKEFLELHAQSRFVTDIEGSVNAIIEEANHLAGEAFDLETPVTSLSGGQSRALMIADTAILSESPIVLIDEIENAGIDRKKALKLLVKEEKIVLIATHDPILALMADRRIIIRNGGIHTIIETTSEEKKLLLQLERVDRFMMDKRHQLRSGEVLMEESIDAVL